MADPNEMQAELERLRAENEALKTQAKRETRLKVSEKGVAVVVDPHYMVVCDNA